MNLVATQMPGYWRFLWMFWMQPILLHECLRECGIEKPDLTGWEWIKHRKQLDPAHNDYLWRLGFVVLIGMLLAVTVFLLCEWMGFYVNIKLAIINLPGFVTGAVAGCVVYGVTYGVAGGVVGGVAYGVVIGVGGDVAFSLAYGVVVGVAVGLTGGMVGDLKRGVVEDVVFGVVFGVVGGVAIGIVGGVAVGVAGCVAAIVTYLRLPMYCLEWIWQVLMQVLPVTSVSGLRYSSLFFHDMSYLPLPVLSRQIAGVAEVDPDLARSALNACKRAPGQRAQGRRALAEIQARELERLVLQRRFVEVSELRGQWLPGAGTDDPLLPEVAGIARFVCAADGAQSPFIARERLQQAAERLQGTSDQPHLPLPDFRAGHFLTGSRLHVRKPVSRYAPA